MARSKHKVTYPLRPNIPFTELLVSSFPGLVSLGSFCTSEGDVFTEAGVARMDQFIAADGLTVTTEAMLNHSVLKKDELPCSTFATHEPDGVIKCGLVIIPLAADPR